MEVSRRIPTAGNGPEGWWERPRWGGASVGVGGVGVGGASGGGCVGGWGRLWGESARRARRPPQNRDRARSG